jgi:glycosyltransferase involved in cell wall biosynthesis
LDIIRKNIILVIGSLELGGAERQALLFAKKLLDTNSFNIQIWGFNSPGRVATLCEEYGIPYRIEPVELSGNLFKLVKNLICFSHKLRKQNPDTIIAFTNYPNVICGIVWRFTGARMFIWNQRDVGIERITSILERISIFNTQYFIANSSQVKDFMVNSLGVSGKNVHLIHNGIELASSLSDRVEWRRRLGINDDMVLACMLGNLSSHKDHVTLLKAWQIVIDNLKKSGKTSVLLLAGRFDQNHLMLKGITEELGIEKYVIFLGHVKDVSGLLYSVDIGVFSSYSEGMPNGVLECMASGLPVVATDIPGIREAVGPDSYEYLAPPGNPQSMSEKILKFLYSSDLRREIGEINLSRITKEFSPQLMFQRMLDVINQDL